MYLTKELALDPDISYEDFKDLMTFYPQELLDNPVADLFTFFNPSLKEELKTILQLKTLIKEYHVLICDYQCKHKSTITGRYNDSIGNPYIRIDQVLSSAYKKYRITKVVVLNTYPDLLLTDDEWIYNKKELYCFGYSYSTPKQKIHLGIDEKYLHLFNVDCNELRYSVFY